MNFLADRFLLTFVGRTLFLLNLFYTLSEKMQPEGARLLKTLSLRGKSYLFLLRDVPKGFSCWCAPLWEQPEKGCWVDVVSQNHRMSQVGRDSQGSWSPTSGPA